MLYLILFFTRSKYYSSFRPDLSHVSFSSLRIHIVFPAGAATPDANPPRKTIGPLLENSMKKAA